MGTNYYAISNKCPACGTPGFRIHIGKSSAGWKFHFRGYDSGYIEHRPHWKEMEEVFIRNRDELKQYLKGKEIESEYGDIISHERFWEMVEKKESAPLGGDDDRWTFREFG